MFMSARKTLAAAAAATMVALSLAACSSSDSATGASGNEPLIQIPDANGRYSAEQDQQWQDVTGNDPNATESNEPEPVISAAVEKSFSVPEDIAPGTYVFEPDYSGEGLFYASYRFGELPNIIYSPDDSMIVELTADVGSFSLAHGEIYVATAEQIASLPQADISDPRAN